MTFEKYFKLRISTEAFSRRDIQMTGVMLEWINQCGYTIEEFLLFTKLFPVFEELSRVGIFSTRQTPEQAKQIRAYERTLPRELRREVRRTRLAYMATGPASKSG